jgi:hypothetical protein
MFEIYWGMPTMFATAEEINANLVGAEVVDRVCGIEPSPEELAEITMEFDVQFLEETIQ